MKDFDTPFGDCCVYSVPPHLANRAQAVAVGRLVLASATFEATSRAQPVTVRRLVLRRSTLELPGSARHARFGACLCLVVARGACLAGVVVVGRVAEGGAAGRLAGAAGRTG